MADTPLVTLQRAGRDIAAAHFQVRGFTVIARDHATRYGVVDLVASKGDTLLFASVAVCRPGTRSYGDPVPVPPRMRRRAAAWLAANPRPRTSEIRFDAIAVVVDAHGRLVSLSHATDAA